MSNVPTNQTTAERVLTLGELLYADPTVALIAEKQWLALIRAIGVGDETALRLVYDKAFPVVFTYLMHLTGNRHVTDTLILDLFERVWCEAPVFEVTDGPVLAWIMRQARSLALDHEGRQSSARRDSGYVGFTRPAEPAPILDGDRSSSMSPALQRGLEALTSDEYQAIEATVVHGLSYSEFAKRCGRPIGTVKSQIRSGFAKLHTGIASAEWKYMSSPSERNRCERRELVAPYALATMEGGEAESMAQHLAVCHECQLEYQAVGGLTDALAASRTQALPHSTALWERLIERVANVSQKQMPAAAAARAQASSLAHDWQEPEWKEVAPGITCKLMSTDAAIDRVSMLVRLAPGVSYPPHRHVGLEELYLLEGELWIGDRKLQPGDYNSADAGTSDWRVWSESGCVCLLITSSLDELR